MRFDFYPDREADMLAWSANFIQQVQSREDRFGLPESTFADFVAAQQRFAEAYTLAADPATRTRPDVARKNDARRDMERQARLISRRLHGNSALTSDDCIALGINVPRRRIGRIKPPAVGPFAQVAWVQGNRVRLKLRDAEHTHRRARPDGADCAALFFAVAKPDGTPCDEWRFFGYITEADSTLCFDPRLPIGTHIHLKTHWVSRRAEFSPPGNPLHATITWGASLLPNDADLKPQFRLTA